MTTTGPIKSKHQLTKIVNDVVLTATKRTFFYTVCRFQNIWKIPQDVLEQKQIPDRFVEFNVCFSSNSGTRSTSGGWGSCMLSHTHELSLEARLTLYHESVLTCLTYFKRDLGWEILITHDAWFCVMTSILTMDIPYYFFFRLQIIKGDFKPFGLIDLPWGFVTVNIYGLLYLL